MTSGSLARPRNRELSFAARGHQRSRHAGSAARTPRSRQHPVEQLRVAPGGVGPGGDPALEALADELGGQPDSLRQRGRVWRIDQHYARIAGRGLDQAPDPRRYYRKPAAIAIWSGPDDEDR